MAIGVMRQVYRMVTRRTSTFVLAIGVGAFAFERGNFRLVSRFFQYP